METEQIKENTGAAAIQISNLDYSYVQEWTFKKKQALKSLSLEIFQGESFGFLGHNGAGKTTTIKCILGLIKPKRGSISIFGKSSTDLTSRKFTGYLPEQPYFYDYLTVTETMHLFASLAGVPKMERNEKVQKALKLVGMQDSAKIRMRALSKGLVQRIAMAQAIVAEPRLLILDEPFSGLDPIGRKEFRELLSDLKKGGTTVFMSSHILSDVEFLCDRVSVLSNGELKGVFDLRTKIGFESGAFELVVRNQPKTREALSSSAVSVFAEDKFLRFVFKEREKAEKALKTALEINAGVESFEFVHGSLEDLFMKLVNGGEQ